MRRSIEQLHLVKWVQLWREMRRFWSSRVIGYNDGSEMRRC